LQPGREEPYAGEASEWAAIHDWKPGVGGGLKPGVGGGLSETEFVLEMGPYLLRNTWVVGRLDGVCERGRAGFMQGRI